MNFENYFELYNYKKNLWNKNIILWRSEFDNYLSFKKCMSTLLFHTQLIKGFYDNLKSIEDTYISKVEDIYVSGEWCCKLNEKLNNDNYSYFIKNVRSKNYSNMYTTNKLLTLAINCYNKYDCLYRSQQIIDNYLNKSRIN